MAGEQMPEQAAATVEPGQEQGVDQRGQAEQFFQAVSAGIARAGETLSNLPDVPESAMEKVSQAQALYQEAISEALSGQSTQEESATVSVEGGATGVPEGVPA